MTPSTACRWPLAFLVPLPLLPVFGFVFDAPPELVFSMGATSFIIIVLLPIWLYALSNMPPAGSPPVAKRFHFTIRGLLCLTTVLFGMTLFFVSAFRCESAERASRPNPVPVAVFRQFVWRSEEHTSELQSLRHLVCRL